jgi:hypothetical protein
VTAAARPTASTAKTPPPTPKLLSPLVLGIGAAVLLVCGGLGVTGPWWFTRGSPTTKEERTEAPQTPIKEDELPRRADDPDPAPRPPNPPQAGPDGGELDPLPPLPDDLPRADVPQLIAQIQSLNKLLEEGRLFAATFGKEKEFEDWLTKFKKSVSSEGLQGLDAGKPWGCYARVENTPNSWAVVVLLPMREEASFRRSLRDMGFEEQGSVGDLVPFKLPQHPVLPAILPVRLQLPDQVYVRFAEGYAHICLAGNPTLLTGDKLLAAAPMFVQRDKLLSVTLRLDRLPEAWRQNLLTKTKDIKNLVPPNDNAIVRGHADKVAELFAGYVEDFLNGARNLSFDLGVNRETERLAADLYLQGAPGSRLADHLASLSATPSAFGSWSLQDAAFGARVNLRLPRELRAGLPAVVEEATRQTLRDIQDPKDRQRHEHLFHTLGKVFAAGELDGTILFRTRGDGPPGLLLGGVKVPNGLVIEQLAREAVNDLDDKAIRALFEMDAEKIGDINVHRFNAQQQFPPDLRKAFGDNPWNYAFRPNAVVWAGGDGVKEALPEALQAAPRETPLLLVMGDLHRFNQIVTVQAGDAELAREVLDARRPGRFRLQLSGGSALRLHVGLDLALLRFLFFRLARVQLNGGAAP